RAPPAASICPCPRLIRSPSHSFVWLGSFLRPGRAQSRCCRAQWTVKAGALAPPGGLGLDGREHGGMLDAAGTAEGSRCRSQGLASLFCPLHATALRLIPT